MGMPSFYNSTIHLNGRGYRKLLTPLDKYYILLINIFIN